MPWAVESSFETRVENLSPAMGRGIDSRNRVWNWVAKLHRLAGRYDNPMPTWFLAPMAGLKLPTQCWNFWTVYGVRNQVGIGFSYRSSRPHRLAESIPWNRFLGSIEVLKKYRLCLQISLQRSIDIDSHISFDNFHPSNRRLLLFYVEVEILRETPLCHEP